MSEKWLEPEEYIILEAKVWTSVSTPLGPGNTRSKVYLTNKRLYCKDSWTRLKMIDVPLSAITKIEKRNKYLRIEAEIKGKKKKMELRLKDMVDNWEWMIRERIKAFER